MPSISRRFFVGYLASLPLSGLVFRSQARAAQELSVLNGWVLRGDDLERLNLR
ncbi:hypothetical protein [Hoeflea olei]|uniref:hypothetical protein n=1 Tax=Hoeflea olei TaxID=1480615 RepID=UPI00149549E9|nr:hypothetical protein [Hoeflea olei]